MTATDDLETFRLFIDGTSVDAASGKTFESQNPYTGRPWATIADGGPEDVDRAVASARAAFEGEWGAKTGFERAAIMRDVAAAITANAERLALLEVRDSGKLMREMLGQLKGLGNWYLYFSGIADKIEGKTVPAIAPQTYFGYTLREPVGVVGAITPWNSPLLLLTFKLAPLLAAGCTCVVKPSEHAPASTVAFAEVLHEAGLPAGVFNVVTGWDRSTGEALASHTGIDKVAFTGSTATGAKVAQAAVANINKVTLELGGKSPAGRLRRRRPRRGRQRPGGRCLRGDRPDLHGRFAADRARVGQGRAGRQGRRARQRDQAGRPDRRRDRDGAGGQPAAVREGPRLPRRCPRGGRHDRLRRRAERRAGWPVREADRRGGRSRRKTIVREEVFGPVLAAYTFRDEDEAIALANDTPYGLAGAVWTKDVHRAHRVAGAIRAGTVWINAYRVVAPNMPFGGFGMSGIGRENGSDARRRVPREQVGVRGADRRHPRPVPARLRPTCTSRGKRVPGVRRRGRPGGVRRPRSAPRPAPSASHPGAGSASWDRCRRRAGGTRGRRPAGRWWRT